MMNEHWSVYRIGRIYRPGMQTCIPSQIAGARDRWVRSVPLPYTGGRLRAAWEVLTGRAVALRWPKAGELEDALNEVA